MLLSIVGTIGQLSLVKSDQPATCSCKLAILRPRKVSPEYLAVFLRSMYGQHQIERLIRGALQRGLILEDMDQLLVPRLSSGFQTRIERLVRASWAAQERARLKQAEAEETLLAALGPADWSPPESLSYVVPAGHVLDAKRLDAQYFMPAKQRVRRALAAIPGRTLADCVDSVADMFVPERNPPTTRVRNYDVTDALPAVLDATKHISAVSAIGSVKKTLKHGDVVVSRLRAYLREIAVVRIGDDIPSVGSSEFIVLRPRNHRPALSPENLMVYLRCAPVQTILRWCQDGSQHPRFAATDLLSIPVPDAVAQASRQVTAIVDDGLAARDQSRHFLESATHGVEVAIEQGEALALRALHGDAEVNT